MTQPREDARDDIIPLKLDASMTPSPAPPPLDLDTLSSEARLATALVMQAQALDGMRRSQDDLLRRVGGAGQAEDGPLRDSVARVHARLDDMRDNQQTAAEQLGRMSRGSNARRLVALLVIVSALGGAAWWIVQGLPADRDDSAVLAALNSADLAQAEQQEVLTETLSKLGADSAQGLAEQEQLAETLSRLSARLDEQQRTSEVAQALIAAERDAARSSLASADARLASQLIQLSELEAAVDNSQTETLSLAGENARLRTLLVERELQRDELLASLENLRLAVVTEEPPPMVTSIDSGATTLAEQLNLVLASGGQQDLRLVEVGAIQAGQLSDVMLVLLDASGEPAGLLRAARGRIVSGSDGPHLLLENPDQIPVLVSDVSLGSTDLGGWEALGVSVPTGSQSLADSRQAVAQLLAAQGLTLLELASVDGQELTGVRLREGSRELLAARVEFDPMGPTLVLHNGFVVAGGEQRAFFRGSLRLPLPGLKPGAWAAALASTEP